MKEEGSEENEKFSITTFPRPFPFPFFRAQNFSSDELESS